LKALVFGKDGQLGQEFARKLSKLESLTKEITTTFVGRSECDLSDELQIIEMIKHVKPQLMINAAAYTAVDLAQTQEQLAHQINAVAPGIMAKEAQKMGATFVHYSTDYVFDGSKVGAYLESDACSPQSVYGMSKYMGEQAIERNCKKYLNFRTSWVFSASGSNFLKTILKLAKTKTELNIINDQCGAPTSTSFIVDATLQALFKNRVFASCSQISQSFARDQLTSDLTDLDQPQWGTFNLVASGVTSWHGYAQYLIQRAIELKMGEDFAISLDRIFPIPSAQYPQAAKRPLNSVLSTEKLTHAFGVRPVQWQSLVDEELEKIKINHY
jgi:dTDP-4-dehydrorhamnose reductase